MPGAFVSTPIPTDRTVMVRSGGSVCFAGFSPWRGWVRINGASETVIEAPLQWWDETAEPVTKGPDIIQKIFRPLAGQLFLDLSDSETQSSR